MCYVHNQWYDISCATLYYNYLPVTVYGTRTMTVLRVTFNYISIMRFSLVLGLRPAFSV